LDSLTVDLRDLKSSSPRFILLDTEDRGIPNRQKQLTSPNGLTSQTLELYYYFQFAADLTNTKIFTVYDQ